MIPHLYKIGFNIAALCASLPFLSFSCKYYGCYAAYLRVPFNPTADHLLPDFVD
jgi:hypothetical protein